MVKRKQIIAIVAIVAIVGVAIGAVLMFSQPKPAEESKLRCLFAWPTDTDPHKTSDFSGLTLWNALYDSLTYPAEGGGVQPWLATEWESSSDAKTWTFQLREGVKFHSGRELTAEDVFFSMQRLKALGLGEAYRFEALNLSESEVVNDYTIRFEYNHPRGIVPIDMMYFKVLEKEAIMNNLHSGDFGEYKDYGQEWLLSNDAGSGPYTITDVITEQYVKMKKFDDYWNGLPENAAETLVYSASGETSTVLTEFKKREVEISSVWMPETSISQLEQTEGIEIADIPSGFLLIKVNTAKKPTDCKYVRKAIGHALNYTKLLEAIHPYDEHATSCISSKSFGYKDLSNLMPDRDSNIEKAEAALEKSKYYPDIVNNPEDYTIKFAWIKVVPAEEDIALLFADAADKIGLDLEPVKTPWGSYVDQATDPETTPNMCPMYNAKMASGGAWLYQRYHSSWAHTYTNSAYLNNTTVDTMLENVLRTGDASERAQLSGELQEIIVRQQAGYWIAEHMYRRAYQAHYVDWPHARGEKQKALMGFDVDPRYIEVNPEKRAELTSLSLDTASIIANVLELLQPIRKRFL